MSDSPEEILSPEESVSELESLLGYSFSDRALLTRALTHRSFVNEHEGEGLKHNESMEFLGDAVLGFLVSARICQRFPDLTEGELSKIKAYLVSAANLVRLAERIQLGRFLRLSRGEDKTGGRNKRALLVDAYEAVLGAVFLDGGVAAVSSFLDRQVGEFLDGLDLRQFIYGDFKSALQEQLHDLGRPEPVYRVVDEIGPDHRKIFVVQVLVRDQVIAEATGTTKKEAQQEAARIALEGLKECHGLNKSAMAANEASRASTPGGPEDLEDP
ncbi:MAG TPA: ribonuclease III [Acidobacteriota bacterium]|nr:ribonuclease III [Acidobacteriota bacterium]